MRRQRYCPHPCRRTRRRHHRRRDRGRRRDRHRRRCQTSSEMQTPPMSGDDGLTPSSSGIAGGLRRPVKNTRGKPLILNVACATWGKPR